MLDRNDLLPYIQAAQDGLTLAEVLQIFPQISRRTAQRWISQLLIEDELNAEGQGRARRYKIRESLAKDEFPTYISISPDSRDILTYIEQPLSARKPVGYNPDFLYSYQPNQTFYLSTTLRHQLAKMGKTGHSQLAAGTYGRTILNRLLIDLSWASSHLEGNTYSLLETKVLIEHGQIAAGKDQKEAQMILNHKAAIEMLLTNIDLVSFNRYTLLNLHSLLSENLLPNPADEGRVRSHAVEIGKSVYHPLAIPQKINELLDVLLSKINQIQDPFEQAFFVMVHLPYLQPFIDVNKRTSRLAANLPFLRDNLCPLTFLGVPESAYTRAILGVYELNRVELLRDLFVWAYERSTQEYISVKQELVEPDPLRLQYRDLIRQTIHDIVLNPEKNPLELITDVVKVNVTALDQENVQALLIEELRRLHEGVLARYQLRLPEFERWRAKQNSRY